MEYAPTPTPSRRPRWIVAAILFALIILAGVGVSLAATAGGSHHPAASPHATATPAADTATAAAVDGPTCKQLLDADTGDYDLGQPVNVWAGHVLAELIGADGIAMQLDGLTQLGFALDLRQACLDPSVFDTPARTVGGAVYRANKSKYTHR